MRLPKKVKKSVLLLLAALPLFVFPLEAKADFDPNQLIKDSQFVDTKTFGGAAGIQQFLQSKNSILANTSPDFLQKLREPADSKIKTGLEDPSPNLGGLRTAAELIWDASQKSGINPQVMLITLQKEQSLVTSPPRGEQETQRALDHALGFNCRESSGCDQLFAGFYYQLFGNFDAQGNRYIGAPASLMRSYNTPSGRGPAVDAQNQTFGAPTVRTSKVGDAIILSNTQGPPNNAAPTQTVTLLNLSTAALYRYTPHVYNGNYNFWKFLTTWFKYQNGTLLRLAGDNNVYIINNGLKSLLANFVMLSRGLNPQTANILTVSQSELSNYDSGPPYPPPDDTIVKTSSDYSRRNYVFEKGVRRPVSEFVLQQRGLNPVNALVISTEESELFPLGSLLVPKEDTLIKGAASADVYVIKEGKKATLSAFTFQQYGYSFKNVIAIPQEEVDSYDSSGFLLPKNGTLIKFADSAQVYMLENQVLRPIGETVFKLRKFNYKNTAVLTKPELANAGTGGFLAPPEGTYFRVSQTDSAYLYQNGTKHPVSAYVAKQRKLKKFIELSVAESAGMPDGLPLPPKDGTLVKGDASGTIYVITNGQKIALDFKTWSKKYRKRKPTILPQAEVDAYPSQPSEGKIEQ